MEDVKSIVAKNIAELRLLNNMTQAELAEKLNYSDKTISKWERGESSPDISVLVEIADIFGVSLDYIVRSESIDKELIESHKAQKNYNHVAIASVSQGAVIFVALFAFILTSLISDKVSFQWLYFVYALPIVVILQLIFNSIWFNPRNNYFIVSLLMWSVLVAIHLSFWHFGINIALIYLLGVLGQVIIFLWSLIKKPKRIISFIEEQAEL
ncbi:MAG: helix-turn-helix transcriptional regulator [Ruminococcus sp.]|nr:helix-turn-helix transcriptional regulator [Ruminococcus sp.]